MDQQGEGERAEGPGHGGKVGAGRLINWRANSPGMRINFGLHPNQFLSTMNITFNELRSIKDRLPDGSIHRIAKELDLNVETVWNYFGGYSHPQGRPMGVHLEGGMGGGVMALDDTRILDLAQKILDEQPRRS